jgi:hypothetical protein
MKRVFILSLLFIASFAYSQSTLLEPGVYHANARGQNILLRVSEDNSYEIAFFHGKFVVENDTITFLNRESNASPFRIRVNKDAAFSSTLKIKFKSQNLLYASRNIYIGTQKEENAVIEYKPLSDFVNKRAYAYADRAKDFKIDVDKGKYLYFVDSNPGLNAIVSKFQINENDHEIEIDYDGSSTETIQLKGIIDPETKRVSIMEGRSHRDILQFQKDDAGAAMANDVKALTVVTEKNWKKNNGFIEERDFDSSYLERRQTRQYAYKNTPIKSLSDGLKSIGKTPEKFLVVVVDDRKEGKKEFDGFIKNYEERMSNVMYEGYNAKRDNFNFYLASAKDKAALDKFKIKEKTYLAFLNANGELLYHTAGTLEDRAELFDSYFTIYTQVKKANEHFKLDKLFTNKKASMTDIKKALLDISNIKMSYGNHYDGVAADSTAVEAVEAIEAAVTEIDTAAAVVDTAAAVYGDAYEDYMQLEDPENLYSVKTPKEVIADKWKLIVDFYIKNNTYDEEFIEMCKKELLNRGFTYKLYGGEALVNDTDFKILDYLYKNYKEIVINEYKKTNDLANEYEKENFYGMQGGYDGITYVLSAFFEKRTDESAHLHRSNQIKLIEYYKSFLQFSGYRLPDFTEYLKRIKETNGTNTAVYLKEYKEFFDKVKSRNPSLVESLDDMFSEQKSTYGNWQDFKHSFALLANNVAWTVVETKNNDSNAIQTAIVWSEASLKLVKNEYHYLDTLAQLYYINNEKEKGIATEKLAIDNLNPNDKERIDAYGEVLESMKKGTY